MFAIFDNKAIIGKFVSVRIHKIISIDTEQAATVNKLIYKLIIRTVKIP